MADILLIIINSFLFIIPAYIGNASAALFVGHGTPIDLGARWRDGRRLFGDGKTFVGFFTGVFLAFAASTTEGYLLQGSGFEVGGVQTYARLGLLLGLGAMLGDLIGSFIKRRAGFERGQHAPLWDQLNFVVGAILVASPVFIPNWPELLVILFATPAIHLFLNWFGHELKLKSVPW